MQTITTAHNPSRSSSDQKINGRALLRSYAKVKLVLIVINQTKADHS